MPKKKRFRSRFQNDDQGSPGGAGGGGAAPRPRAKKPRRRYGPNYQQAFTKPEDEQGEVAVNEEGEPIPTDEGDAPAEEPGQEFYGLLEMHPNGYGFLRSSSNNYSRERTDDGAQILRRILRRLSDLHRNGRCAARAFCCFLLVR